MNSASHILSSKKLARSFIYMLSSTGVVLLISLAITVSLARLTSPRELGIILTAEAFVEMFLFFFYFGFGNSILRIAAEDPKGFIEGIQKATGNALLIKVIMFIPLGVTIYIVSRAFEKNTFLIEIITLYIFIYFFESIANIFGIARRAIGQFKLMSWIQVFNKLLRLANIIIVLKFFGGIKLLIITFLIEKIIRLFVSAITTMKFVKPRIDLSLIKPMLKHCFGYAFVDPLAGVQGKLDRLILHKFHGATAVAFYSIPLKFTIALSSIHQAITQVFSPTLHRTYDSEPEMYKTTLRHLSRFLAITGAFVFIFITFYGEFLLLKIFGNKYSSSITIVGLVAYTALIDMLDRPCELVLTSQASHKNRITIKSIGIITAIALNLILIPIYGIKGVIYATIAAGIIKLMISYKIVHKYLETIKSLMIVIFPIIGVQFLNIYILVPLYLIYLWLLRLLTKEDIDFVIQALKRRKKQDVTIED